MTNELIKTLRYVHGYTSFFAICYKGEQPLSLPVCFCGRRKPKRVQLFKIRICSYRSKFFPLELTLNEMELKMIMTELLSLQIYSCTLNLEIYTKHYLYALIKPYPTKERNAYSRIFFNFTELDQIFQLFYLLFCSLFIHELMPENSFDLFQISFSNQS